MDHFLANDLWIIFPLFWILSQSKLVNDTFFPKLPELDGFMVKMSAGYRGVNDVNAYWWEIRCHN